MTISMTEHITLDRADEILTPEALAFVEKLHRHFAARRDALLEARATSRRGRPAGTMDFLPETQHIRDADWKVPTPKTTRSSR